MLKQGVADGPEARRASSQITAGLQASRATSNKAFGILAKRTATALSKSKRLTPKRRLELCLQLLRKSSDNKRLLTLIESMRLLSLDEQHYWIGTFYTLLLSPDQRRKQSAYFTPPEIARHLLRLMEEEGVDFAKASVLDPAAGGAAFLSMVAGRMKELGCAPKNILRRIKGIELDPMLAELARKLIAERLGLGAVHARTVIVKDALQTKISKQYDVVLANPPYGRVFPNQTQIDQYSDVCHPGCINKYALFVDLCLKRARPGGHIGLAIPSSFIAGPLYSHLRRSMRSRSAIKVLGQIECREEFFWDVKQDVSLLVLNRASPRTARAMTAATVPFGRIDKSGNWNSSLPIALPADLDAGWLLPSPSGGARGGANLADYGCKLTSGYLVWNREPHRMSKGRRRGKSVPLFWACNIKANKPCRPDAKDGVGTDFVRFDEENQAIIRGPSILIQRTTNTKQPRRLVAACVDSGSFLSTGYVSENHTIVLRPQRSGVDLTLVCRLLNSAAVDLRYRQLSGTASISTILLRGLDLPTPQNLATAIASTLNFEAAVERAYALSAATKWRAAS